MDGDETTLQDMLAVMGPVTTNLSMEPAFFDAMLQRLHEEFGVQFDQVQEAYTFLDRAIPSIGGRYRSQTAKIDRKKVHFAPVSNSDIMENSISGEDHEPSSMCVHRGHCYGTLLPGLGAATSEER